MDTSQSYKGGPPQPQTQSRSAASPLSPPRSGPGAPTSYSPFAGAGAPVRYIQQSSYGTGIPFRENQYARVPQVPSPQIDYRAAPVVSVPNSLSVSIGPSPITMETGSSRPRISLLPVHGTDYLPVRSTQAPPDPGGQPAFKKIRLGDPNQQQSQPIPPLLKVDTREPSSVGAYHPQVEAISPTLPNDPIEELRVTKDELLQQITKVDNEIEKTEKNIALLKKKEASLEEASAKPAARAEEVSEAQPKHRSLAQQIYAENRKKSAVAHAVLATLGATIELPLYNQVRRFSYLNFFCFIFVQLKRSFFRYLVSEGSLDHR